MEKSIVGYIVLPSSRVGTIAFVPTLEAAKQRGEGWDWIARVWSDGTVTAGDDSEAGLCGMGLGGDYTVSRAAEWLAQRPARWLREQGITA
jgi:hypothetical protein